MIFAGFPATTVYGGTSSVTTEPAPTMLPSPIVTPGRRIAPVPMSEPLHYMIRFLVEVVGHEKKGVQS